MHWKHTEKELIKAMGEVEELYKQVADAKTKAQKAKEEGADSDSIEAVANWFLELSIIASPPQIEPLADDIKDCVRSLSNVDAILEQTQDDVLKAVKLLMEAKRPGMHTLGIKQTEQRSQQTG
ncbi:hypothetical protein AOLI_G00286950 [Acnodon oligacanthus]